MQVQDLLDKAKEQTGSDSATARALGLRVTIVSDWRAGIRTCSAEDRALLADLAGIDIWPEVAAAMLERLHGKPRGAQLARVLEKSGLIRI